MKNMKLIALFAIVNCALSSWGSTSKILRDSQPEFANKINDLKQSCELNQKELTAGDFKLPEVTYPEKFSDKFRVGIDQKHNTFSIQFYSNRFTKLIRESLTLDFNRGLLIQNRDNSGGVYLTQMNKDNIKKTLDEIASTILFSARGISMDNEERGIDNKQSVPLKKLSCMLDAINLTKNELFPNSAKATNRVRDYYINGGSPLAKSCNDIKPGDSISLKNSAVRIYPKTGLIISKSTSWDPSIFENNISKNIYAVDTNLCLIREHYRFPDAMFLLTHTESGFNHYYCSEKGMIDASIDAKIDLMSTLQLNAIIQQDTDPNSKHRIASICIRDSLEQMLKNLRTENHEQSHKNPVDGTQIN